MTFGRKGAAAHKPSPKRPTNVAQVVGTPSREPKRNRIFGSAIFGIGGLVIGGFGIWADRQVAAMEDGTSPIWITSIMALAFIAFAALNLFSERRIIGSHKTRLRKD